MSFFWRQLLLSLVAFAVALTGAAAQNFPTASFASSCRPRLRRRPISWPASSPTRLSDGEGWKVIVENKPGGVMTIGAIEVLKQPADGHTIFSVTAPFAAAPALVPNAPFNYDKDFAPLIRIGTGYNVLVVNPSVPVHSVAELSRISRRTRQAHLLVGRLRHARASARRVVQARNRRSRRRTFPTCSSRRRSAIWSAA